MNENMQENMQDELTRVIEPEVFKMGAVPRLISLFTNPGELMKNIKHHPVILVPFLVAVALGLLAAIPLQTVTDMQFQEMSHISIERYGFDIFAIADYGDIYGDFDMEAVMDATVIVLLIASALAGPLFLALLTAVGLIIFSKIMRGEATFGQLFSMYLHIYVVFAFGSLISISLMSFTNTLTDMTSLAALLPHGNMAEPSFLFASTVSIFSVWTYFLMGLGFKVLNNVSAVKATITTVIMFLIYAGITVVMGMLTWWMYDVMI